jgi:PGF-CTERM protein
MKLSMPGTAVLLILTAIALSFAVTPVIAQAVEVRVNAPEYVEEGATFVATIDVDSVTDFNSAQFDLSFDSSVVEVIYIKDGEINGEEVPIFGWSFMNAETVRPIVMMGQGEGVSGSGYLAEIEFKVKGDEGVESVLDISNGMLRDKKGKVHLFTIDKKFKDELNNEEISNNLKGEFEYNGYPLENPTVKVKKEDRFWDIIDFPNRVYGVRAQSGVLNIGDTGEILANWIDAEIRIGVEEKDGEEPPDITEWDPTEEVVSSVEGEPRTFEIIVDQTVDISWQINGTEVQTDESVTEASFTNTSAVVGTWNVSAIAISTTTGLSDMHTWIWSVTTAATATVTPTPTEVVGEIPPAETETEGTPTPTVAPRVTPNPTAAPPTEKNPTPAATPTPAVPGFEAIFAITGLLAIAYILRRRCGR